MTGWSPLYRVLLNDFMYHFMIQQYLTLYMLNFSEGTKTFIYILCHSSTLACYRTWSVLGYDLNQCENIGNWILWNKFHWTLSVNASLSLTNLKMSVKRPQCVKNHILRNEISDVNELGTRVITGITAVLFSANWSKNLANTPSNGWVYSLWHDVTTQYVGYANMPMQIGRCCSMQFCSFIWVLQRERCHYDTAQYNMMFNITHTT